MKRIIAVILVALAVCAAGSCKQQSEITTVVPVKTPATAPAPAPPLPPPVSPVTHAAEAPPAGLPVSIEAGKDFTLPCDATLQAVVEKCYRHSKFNSGGLSEFELKAVGKRLAAYNKIPDPSAVQHKGTVIKLPLIYVIQRGDTLWKICGKVYGKATRVRAMEIERANGITDVKKIKAGTALVLP